MSDCICKHVGYCDGSGPDCHLNVGCVCQNQHRRGYCTEPGCPYAVERKRIDDMELADLRQALEVMQAGEVIWRQTDRALRDEIKKHQTNVRHWREECGKLYAQLAKAKADLRAWEITAKRVAEADFLDFSLAPERSAASIARAALASRGGSDE